MCQPAQPSCTHSGVPSTGRMWLQSNAPQLGEFSSSPSSLLLYHILLTSSQLAVSPILWLISAAGTPVPAHRGRGLSPPSPTAGSCYRKLSLALLGLGDADWRAVTALVRVWHTWTCNKSRGRLEKHSSNQYLGKSYQIILFPVLGRMQEWVLLSGFS